MTTRKRTTTHSRPRKETVAEPQEVESADKAVAAAPSDVVEEPTSSMAAEPPATDPVPAVEGEADMGNGFCDNHPDRPAVVTTNFTWTSPQRFCARCLPPHYRHLL